MKVSIITGPCLSTTHGTGAQILRTFGPSNVPFFHLYWKSNQAGMSEHSGSYLLENIADRWPWRRGASFAGRLERAGGVSWWRNDTISTPKLRRLRKSRHLQCDVAYVVIADEVEARRANSLLSSLGCPYVVHLMDILDEKGLNPASMPGYRRLLENASSVLALNAAIYEEVQKFAVKHSEIVGFGQEVVPAVGHRYSQKLRMLIAGSLFYEASLEALSQAWPMIVDIYKEAELHHVGAYAHKLPSAIRSCVIDHGYVSNSEYQKILSASTLAYLPAPATLDHHGRFSIPSRVADFFMSGLPVVVYTASGTATEKFVEPLVPGCVRLARNSEDIVAAVSDFMSSEDRWRDASLCARGFAVSELSSDVVRDRILKTLGEAQSLPDSESREHVAH